MALLEVDMQRLGVDVLISAPQKGWSGPASSGSLGHDSSAAGNPEAQEDQRQAEKLRLQLLTERQRSGPSKNSRVANYARS